MDSVNYLGKTVTIQIDRPLGSPHPQHGFIYPVNYGFLPGTTAGDGEELDAYLLGVFEPVKLYTGVCIAVIHRLDDEDDKLVVAPHGSTYTPGQIRALTEFQERFFTSEILT
jgi:inorganic pyrophosphatase